MLSIAVDLDGVLANTISSVCKIVNERYSTQFEPSSFVRWRAWEIAQIPKDEFFQILDQAWYNWRTIPPTEEKIGEKLRPLRPLGRVDIVTGRSPDTVPSALSWLSEHDVQFDSFVRTDSVVEKVELAYDVFIDDSPDLMTEIASSPHKSGIVYTQPWNKDTPELNRIHRANQWDEIPKLVQKITEASE